MYKQKYIYIYMCVHTYILVHVYIHICHTHCNPWISQSWKSPACHTASMISCGRRMGTWWGTASDSPGTWSMDTCWQPPIISWEPHIMQSQGALSLQHFWEIVNMFCLAQRMQFDQMDLSSCESYFPYRVTLSQTWKYGLSQDTLRSSSTVNGFRRMECNPSNHRCRSLSWLLWCLPPEPSDFKLCMASALDPSATLARLISQISAIDARPDPIIP